MPSTETESHPITPSATHAYRPHGRMAKALLKALGLEGHRVSRIEMVFDVTMAVTVKVYEFAAYEKHEQLVRFLSGYEWHEVSEVSVEPVVPEVTPDPDGVRDVTALDDSIRQHARAGTD